MIATARRPSSEGMGPRGIALASPLIRAARVSPGPVRAQGGGPGVARLRRLLDTSPVRGVTAVNMRAMNHKRFLRAATGLVLATAVACMRPPQTAYTFDTAPGAWELAGHETASGLRVERYSHSVHNEQLEVFEL